MKMGYHQSIMLGYVTIEKSELKVREYDVYQGYYCGICKSIGSRLGQVPRMTLSYDAVFLALLLFGLSEGSVSMDMEHCIIHPVVKKPVIHGNDAIDYAADVMVILAYHKMLDDWRDDRSPLALAGKTALSSSYRKLKKRHPAVCSGVEEGLSKLSALEQDQSGSLDRTCEAFADIMEVLFTGYDRLDFGKNAGPKRALTHLARNLGRWIYAVDALDDYEKDCRDGSYNPLIYRKNNLEGIGDLLYNYLAEISNAYDLLDLKQNRGIVENIIFMGIRRRTDLILRERTETEDE